MSGPHSGLGGFVPDCSPRQIGTAAKQESIMRCKHGDLAIIVQDFGGCERNIGVIVRVIGPAINHPETPMPCWQIKPVNRRKLWLTGCGGTKSEFVSRNNPAYHPDPWLLPIKGDHLVDTMPKENLMLEH
jgi:hypothetical protein